MKRRFGGLFGGREEPTDVPPPTGEPPRQSPPDPAPEPAPVSAAQVEHLRGQVAQFHDAVSALIERVSALHADLAAGHHEDMRQLAGLREDTLRLAGDMAQLQSAVRRVHADTDELHDEVVALRQDLVILRSAHTILEEALADEPEPEARSAQAAEAFGDAPQAAGEPEAVAAAGEAALEGEPESEPEFARVTALLEAEPEAAPEPSDLTGEYVPEGEAEEAGDEPREVPLWPDPGEYAPYRDSDEHLDDELERVDWLVRAQALRWQLMVGEPKSEQYWGMLTVSAGEFEAYRDSDFVPPGTLPAELREQLLRFWFNSRLVGERIRKRLEDTPAEVKAGFTLLRLTGAFGLSPVARDVVLLCLLADVEERYRRLFGYLADDAANDRPTADLALQILYPEIAHPRRLDDEAPPARWRAAIYDILHPEAPLLRHHLLAAGPEIQDEHPLARRLLRLDDRISGFLVGAQRLDGRIAPLLEEARTRPSWDDLHLPPGSPLGARLAALAEWLPTTLARDGRGATLYLDGPYGSGRLRAAAALCATVDIPLLVARGPLLLEHSARHGFDLLVKLCYREARLRGAALYWAECEALLENEANAARWDYLLDQAEAARGITFIASATAWDPAGRFDRQPFTRLPFTAPGTQERRALWRRLLPAEDAWADLIKGHEWLVDRLANAFQLTEGQMRDAVTAARESARSRDPLAPRLTVADILDGCRRQSTRRLISFTRRIEPRPHLDVKHLVLPEANKRQFLELLDRVEHRGRLLTEFGFERGGALGRGLLAMFAGASGTGKTMAAEVLAGKKGYDLYKIDLAAVVSKWVGETEKNLGKLFAEAEESSAILFFDEADALFGKRGEVREAHDRWANIEANYLLQRIEEYPNVVILATNLRQNLDEAFLRRIQHVVEFPFPDKLARARIWRGQFPREVTRPRDEEIADLAERFEIAGGSISNAVFGAASRALKRDPATPQLEITTKDLVLEVAREYQKLGKALTQQEFGKAYYPWVVDELLNPQVGEE